MNTNDETTTNRGTDVWKTESFIPHYRAGEYGVWKIQPGGQLVHDWGYHSGPCLVQMLPSLARNNGSQWETWMSLTPHEIESQELGYLCATGNVVVMGLGMGWIAANIALNPQVKSVDVIESDNDVVELYSMSGASDSIPAKARDKITINIGNALDWRPTQPIDFLYADIWLGLAEPKTLQQVRQMHANTQAQQIYFWGQEILLHSASKPYCDDDQQINHQAISLALANDIRLPLVVPDHVDYPRMIESVIQNRINRRLPIAFPIE